MTDAAKVLRGVICCSDANKLKCDECPYDYNGRGMEKYACTAELAYDVRSLLKERPEIVRCKDCAKSRICCIRRADDPDWFCADGEV